MLFILRVGCVSGIRFLDIKREVVLVGLKSTVVMDATLGTGIFKPEKNLEFFRLKNPGTQRWLSW